MAQTVASGSMEETNENFVNKLNLCEPPDLRNQSKVLKVEHLFIAENIAGFQNLGLGFKVL